MEVYTYSEARQKLANLLDKAETSGKVIIRRKDGSTFALTPERTPRSPLDVPSIRANISTHEIVDVLRKERRRTRGLPSRRRGLARPYPDVAGTLPENTSTDDTPLVTRQRRKPNSKA